MEVSAIDIYKWAITGVEVVSPRTAVIRIYIPGSVKNKDHINVSLNVWDRLRGLSLEDKTLSALKKWEEICAKKNTEIDRCRAAQKIILTRHQQRMGTNE